MKSAIQNALGILPSSARAEHALGGVQLNQLEHDLLDAQSKGITWKFVNVSVPIQNFGPIMAADRFEGYAAERDALLKFINDNHIENVVFVSADFHTFSVNNLTYQDHLGGRRLPPVPSRSTRWPSRRD